MNTMPLDVKADYGVYLALDRLTVLKAKDILERGVGKTYNPVGLVLYAAGSGTGTDVGEVCIIDRGAVRWLTAIDHRTLMHPSPDAQCKGMKLGYLPKDP